MQIVLSWTGPDSYGILSAQGTKRLAFSHDGRALEVRAVHLDGTGEWLLAIKEGDRFVAPRAITTVSDQKIFDARQQGGLYADLLETLMTSEHDAVIAGAVVLLDFDQAPDRLAV
ncbi:hypothetical protein OVA11_06045 [Caulobacter sp. SL161]|uniref:hypothetical protein n=1 Tax=Caulobacter sp. SL161 TaxID=2995156 RepID=UPI0022727C57|nr:hypothetical protein [Caulobacter sp. SL161]MCY1646650.1 hypothetical protein [Caulobacter sp. SL161]